MRISDCSSDVCSSDLTRLSTRSSVDLPAPFRPRMARRSPSPISKLTSSRSEVRRGGKECVSTCRSRWSTDHEKNNYCLQTNKSNIVKNNHSNNAQVHALQIILITSQCPLSVCI